MALVATLVANPSNPVLTASLGEAAADAILGGGGGSGGSGSRLRCSNAGLRCGRGGLSNRIGGAAGRVLRIGVDIGRQGVDARHKRILDPVEERSGARAECGALGTIRRVGRCGYSDVSSFRKLFKRATSVTPADYRERFRLRAR